ncbi:MAG: DNA-binding MarR family transcriptional regulator, partial [Paracoccaceae bacterium]
GLHPSQFVVLGNLARLGDGKTPAALAQAFQVPKASMTNTLMQLERRALIDVRQHAQDGRKKQVYLTDAGRDVYLSVISGMEGPLARLSEGVEGLEEILPVLMALRTRMDANRDP